MSQSTLKLDPPNPDRDRISPQWERVSAVAPDSTAIPSQSPSAPSPLIQKNAPWQSSLSRGLRFWKGLSLQHKATILAIAIGAIPVATVGGVAYTIANSSLEQQIIAEQENRTLDVRRGIGMATQQIIDDAETIGNSPMLANSKLRAAATEGQKIALLDSFVEARSGRYDSIVVFDLKGNLIFQSKSTQPFKRTDNYSDREYFRRAIATGTPAVNNPKIAPTSGKISLEVAAPIKDIETNKLVGVVRLRMPLTHLNETFEYIEAQGWEYKLIGADGNVFAADEIGLVGHYLAEDFRDLPQLRAKVLALASTDRPRHEDKLISTQVAWDKNDGENALMSFTPIGQLDGLPEPGWGLVVSRPVDRAFAPLLELRRVLWLGTGVAALSIAAIATVLAKRATHPILNAARAVAQIGLGKLDTRVAVRGTAEMAVLETSINSMAKQLEELVQLKAAEARRSQLLKDITVKIGSVIDCPAILNTAVAETRSALLADRAIVYWFDGDRNGSVVVEAASAGITRILGKNIANYALEQYAQYQKGQVEVVSQIRPADTSDEYWQQLTALAVKSSLAAPILLGDRCVGLLVVHQCNVPRHWQKVEVDFFAQIATQIGLALERADLLEQQKNAKEQLQRRALDLLIEVDPISQGDLTIRARVTEDEIGTIADSYNSTVESLQEIAVQAQTAAKQVDAAISSNEPLIQALSQGAWQQSTEIVTALERIQAMADSAHTVADNAKRAEIDVRQAMETVASGDIAMDRAVDGMLTIRGTVAETVKKIKCLGESSQKIYKVVNLIAHFAERTSLLAMNASIEAARAGEEGRGFAAVADEVRSLARQSAKATAEIEKLVSGIQRETNEVATAMAIGTEQVAVGTQLVNDTRQSLNHITTASDRIHQLVGAIAQAAIEQSQDSEAATTTIATVATIAETTSLTATEVSASFQQLSTVARSLQASVGQFKVS
ncbi:GAF domain-containing protein [Chroococcidiopsis sp. FACHB-1243]|uniref:methyl-accepting chemotaxis protein n=1 Tax=Chroococcidiopsis sp. [FACHB-1243] TaxID=2692781 RepID=UPI00177FB05E|nr:methyl-accepting chemotaxis protein [Chroococcidiopsis sp. [FACHB-1243]]MBD2308424.1 GAF domain-containing protein [Chroococcidiopsis sp. [FACHB-1243]]